MNIDQAFPSKYLKASDLPEEVLVPVVIENVTLEEIGQGDDKSMKPIIHFKGKDKALVCNKTNANMIAKVTGSRDTDDWLGKTIRIYRTEVQFGAEMVESIRVSSKVPGAKPTQPVQKALQELTEEDTEWNPSEESLASNQPF